MDVPWPVVCSASGLNCSEPTTLALLHGLMPIFELKDIRPVLNMTTVSVVSIDFVLYGILGVVSLSNFTERDDFTLPKVKNSWDGWW